MKDIFGFIKKIPADVRQAAYSLGVSVLLISGALFMLGGYLDTLEKKPDAEVAATVAEDDELDEPDEDS